MRFAVAALLLALASLASFTEAATIHGSVYNANLDLLDKAIVTVNTTPAQRAVAENAFYSLDVPPGDYALTASYNNGTHVFTTTERISVRDADGEYEIDLVIETLSLPFNEPEELDGLDALNETLEFPEEAQAQTQTPTHAQTLPPAVKPPDYSWLIVIAFIAILALLPWVWLRGRRRIEEKIAAEEKEFKRELEKQAREVEAFELKTKKKQEKPEKQGKPALALTKEQRELLRKIEENGGRTTQKELRKLVSYSEAKVSLDLDVLEAQGLIRKFKKGRGNIIVLAK